jgi:hypothetical protein
VIGDPCPWTDGLWLRARHLHIHHEEAARRHDRAAGGSMSATASIAPGPQYMQALQRANEVRLARAGLKRRVAGGELSVADVLLGSYWEAENMTISDLLMSQRRWGQTRCRKLLMQVPVSENKPVGKMTERQRRALAQLLEQPARQAQRDLAPVLAL